MDFRFSPFLQFDNKTMIFAAKQAKVTSPGIPTGWGLFSSSKITTWMPGHNLPTGENLGRFGSPLTVSQNAFKSEMATSWHSENIHEANKC